MSYVDEVIERIVQENPAAPEFHQAVKEVLESLRPVVEENETRRSSADSLRVCHRCCHIKGWQTNDRA